MDIFYVDAFTSERFRGNPAAVCLLESAVPDTWMQSLAAEINLSETAFVQRSDGAHSLRWFTPTTEVDLCGHATLAAAHILFEIGEAAVAVTFATASGDLTVSRAARGLEMDFPALPVLEITSPPSLESALGVGAQWTGAFRQVLLVALADEREVRELAPHRELLLRLDFHGVVVTAAASVETEADFVSRYFAPAVGIDEDPVTGSTHCALGPYWAARLNKSDLVGYQASSRGGTVGVRLNGERVVLRGEAVTVLRGAIM